MRTGNTCRLRPSSEAGRRFGVCSFLIHLRVTNFRLVDANSTRKEWPFDRKQPQYFCCSEKQVSVLFVRTPACIPPEIPRINHSAPNRRNCIFTWTQNALIGESV
jgi:hypothetical protein